MLNPEKPDVIIAFPVAAQAVARLREHFTVHYVPAIADRNDIVKEVGARVVAVITNGMFGWENEHLASMPKLRIISAFGAGYESLDAKAANDRGIAVSYGRDTNTASVADHALALLFSIVRDIPGAAQSLKAGLWGEARHARPDITGRRIGIFGLGLIGKAIAKRARAFDMDVAYHNRKPDPTVDFLYVDSLEGLAERSDFLVCAAPGGQATFHAVGERVLARLGPDGYVVNVGRGTVVDTDALATALTQKIIAGAALDVFEGEPKLPEALRDAPNLIVTPHIGGFSPNSFDAYIRSVIDNIDARLRGEPILTPIPGSDADPSR
jgi:lactate dehydrogenase-like 2-hydroxyacid dehydrogenase